MYTHLSLSLLVRHTDKDQLHTGLCVWVVRVNIPVCVCVCAKCIRMCVCVWVGGWVPNKYIPGFGGFFFQLIIEGN